MGHLLIVDLLLGGIGLYLVKTLLTPKQTPAPLPPGPSPKPLIGNLTDLPPAGIQEWVHWGSHKQLYGPLSSVSVLGSTIIIINSARIAFDLFEKRSAMYSDRPKMTFGGEMVGWDDALSSQMYSDRFRAYRKNIHAVMGSKGAVSRFHPMQEVEIRRFCLRVLEEPEKLLQHIRTEAGAIILSIAYGYNIEPRKNDPLVDLADEALVQFSIAASPGAWLVDTMPFLKNLPDWVPGTGFKKTAARWRATLMKVADIPYELVKYQLSQGTAKPSYVQALLESSDEINGHGSGAKKVHSAEDEFVFKWSAASLYTGGADTTVSSISCFFLAMSLFPEVQRKAQAELDSVIGTDRLPTFSDRPDLPYIDAIVKEVLRWHPVAPMGLPHVTSEDDIYEGHFIPKGSMLMPNIHGFTHDPAIYHDPMTFNPDRFLGPNPEPDTHTLSFGFGRRICPGRELADSSIFLNIAMSLAVFNISKEIGKDGKEVEPHVKFMPGIISHPEPYKVRVVARNGKAEGLVRSVEEEYPFKESDSKELEKLGVKI